LIIHRLAPRQLDPHSVELRSTPLPRSTGERKGASSPILAPFLSLRRGERWLGKAETEWGKPLVKREAAGQGADLGSHQKWIAPQATSLRSVAQLLRIPEHSPTSPSPIIAASGKGVPAVAAAPALAIRRDAQQKRERR